MAPNPAPAKLLAQTLPDYLSEYLYSLNQYVLISCLLLLPRRFRCGIGYTVISHICLCLRARTALELVVLIPKRPFPAHCGGCPAEFPVHFAAIMAYESLVGRVRLVACRVVVIIVSAISFLANDSSSSRTGCASVDIDGNYALFDRFCWSCHFL